MNEACDFTGGPHAIGEAKCKNLDELCDVTRMILRYFSRSICYRKRLTALYMKEGTEDLLIISCSAELMKLQLASQILPCLYQHVVVIAFIIDIKIGSTLAFIKGKEEESFIFHYSVGADAFLRWLVNQFGTILNLIKIGYDIYTVLSNT